MNKETFLNARTEALRLDAGGMWSNGTYCAVRCLFWRRLDDLDKKVFQLWLDCEFKRSGDARTILPTWNDMEAGREYFRKKEKEEK